MDESPIAKKLRDYIPGLDVQAGSRTREYGRDEGYARRGRRSAPDAVAAPTSVAQVQDIVRFAAANAVAVTAWGAGSSLEGQGLAFKGGITIDMRGMAKVRRLLLDDFQVEVDTGITHEELNRVLRSEGVFFPPNPGAPATIGGMIGNNSSGSRAVKYGVTRDYIMALDVVLADGRLVTFGSRAAKTSSGYDLVDLIVGAEGTLGIVTAAVLRVAPTPVYSRGIVARLTDVFTAASVVQLCLAYGIRPASLELLDKRVIPMMARLSPLAKIDSAALLIDCDGSSRQAVDEEIQLVSELVVDAGGWIEDLDQSGFQSVMAARKKLGPEVVRASGMKTLKLVDVAVPLSAFAPAVELAYKVLDDAALNGYVFGHAGDGNLHVLIASDSRDEDLWSRASKAADDIVLGAIALEGTITGEHGIGAAKRHLLRAEHGDAVDVMAAIKHALDPHNVFNPGKVLPDDALVSGRVE